MRDGHHIACVRLCQHAHLLLRGLVGGAAAQEGGDQAEALKRQRVLGRGGFVQQVGGGITRAGSCRIQACMRGHDVMQGSAQGVIQRSADRLLPLRHMLTKRSLSTALHPAMQMCPCQETHLIGHGPLGREVQGSNPGSDSQIFPDWVPVRGVDVQNRWRRIVHTFRC